MIERWDLGAGSGSSRVDSDFGVDFDWSVDSLNDSSILPFWELLRVILLDGINLMDIDCDRDRDLHSILNDQ